MKLKWNWFEAAELYRAGWSYPRIGRHIGVHHTNVMRVLKSRGINESRPVGRPSKFQVGSAGVSGTSAITPTVRERP